MAKEGAAAIQKLAEIRKTFSGMKFGQYKKDFEDNIIPRYRKNLERHGRREARNISRTGELAANIITGRGRAGKGYPAVWLGAKGPAAAYAGILDHGGWQRKTGKYLTIPLDAVKDRKTGKKKKSVRDFPSKFTFLWDIPEYKANVWGGLAGQKVLFKKTKNFPAYGKGSRSKKGPYGSGPRKDRIYFHKIVPIFIYATENYVGATFWATKAMRASKADVQKMIKTYNRNYVKKKKR